ncbi:MAG: hypothetical protein WCK04_04980 [Actinomycetes bacterium]
MASNSGTITPASTLISGASNFTPVAESDVIRWAIGALNKINAGSSVTNAPSLTLIESNASLLGQIESPKILNAILLQLLVGILGGTTGRSQVIYGSGTPENVAYGTVGDLYIDIAAYGLTSRFYVKNTGDGTKTGWTVT